MIWKTEGLYIESRAKRGFYHSPALMLIYPRTMASFVASFNLDCHMTVDVMHVFLDTRPSCFSACNIEKLERPWGQGYMFLCLIDFFHALLAFFRPSCSNSEGVNIFPLQRIHLSNDFIPVVLHSFSR